MWSLRSIFSFLRKKEKDSVSEIHVKTHTSLALMQKKKKVLKTRTSKILANAAFFNLHGCYTDVHCTITFKLYIFYTFFDMEGIFHNKIKKKTEVKINYEVD